MTTVFPLVVAIALHGPAAADTGKSVRSAFLFQIAVGVPPGDPTGVRAEFSLFLLFRLANRLAAVLARDGIFQRRSVKMVSAAV